MIFEIRSFKNLRVQRSSKFHARIFEIKDLPNVFGRSSISNIIQGHFGRSSMTQIIQGYWRSEIIQGSSRSKIIQIPFKNLRDQRSSVGLRQIFEIKDHSRTFGRSSISKIMKGSSVDFRDQQSINDPWKIFDIKNPPNVFRSSRSKIIRGVRPTSPVGKIDGKIFSPETDVDDNSNVSVDYVVYLEIFDN